MKPLNSIFVFQELEDYRISGIKKSFFHEKRKIKEDKWGFLLKNVLNFEELMNLMGTDENAASFGMIAGKSYMGLRDYIRTRDYIAQSRFILLGPNYPVFISPSFSIKKGELNIYKEGNIALLTRAYQTLEYGIKYLYKRGYRVKYGVSLGQTLFPFYDFFEIVPHFFKEDVDVIICINESGTFLNLPDFRIEKPVILLEGGTFLFNEESRFKDYIEKIGVLTPEKSINNLIKKGINITYTFKDLIGVLKAFGI